MRKKGIKFSLELKDGAEARNMDELRENFDLEKVIGYFQDGKLITWLEHRFYDDEADKIRSLSENDPDLGKRLCDILGAEYTEIGDMETVAWRKERLDHLKQYTADPEILNRVDMVAFDQEDLEDIIREEDTDVIYLCQNKFTFPSGILRKRNMRYVGIGKNVEVKAELPNGTSFSDLKISLENIIINEVRTDQKTGESKSSTKINSSSEIVSEWWKQTDFLAELLYRVCCDETKSTFFASWEKPVFLYNGTIKNTNSYRNFNPHLFLGRDETMIGVMPVLSNRNMEQYVVFSDQSVNTIYPQNSLHLTSVSYSNIKNVTKQVSYSDKKYVATQVRVYGKDDSSIYLPCLESYSDAMRCFLLVAANQRSILFENDNYLYNMKFDSLNGKTIGQLLE